MNISFPILDLWNFGSPPEVAFVTAGLKKMRVRGVSFEIRADRGQGHGSNSKHGFLGDTRPDSISHMSAKHDWTAGIPACMRAKPEKALVLPNHYRLTPPKRRRCRQGCLRSSRV